MSGRGVRVSFFSEVTAHLMKLKSWNLQEFGQVNLKKSDLIRDLIDDWTKIECTGGFQKKRRSLSKFGRGNCRSIQEGRDYVESDFRIK